MPPPFARTLKFKPAFPSLTWREAYTLVKIFRIQDWYYLLGLATFAFIDFHLDFTLIKGFVALAFAALYLGYGYAFNNYFDKQEDCAQKNYFKENLSEMGQLATICSCKLLVLLAAWRLGFFQVALLICTINILYSVPPFRLKRFLLFSLTANSFFFAFVYFSSAKIINPNNYWRLMPLLPFISAMFIPLQYIHFLEDTKTERGTIQKLLCLFAAFVPLYIWIYFAKGSIGFVGQFVTVLFSLLIFLIVGSSQSNSKARVSVRYAAMIIGLIIFLERLYGALA